jgi:thiamine biosynthesis lipoprotein
VVVSAETFDVVQLAITAWHLTDGWFDPTILPMLLAAGYDRSFERIAGRTRWNETSTSGAPGCAGIELDSSRSTVRLPAGIAFDLGGIGKGRAADLIAAEAMTSGAAGVCIDLGGDVAVAGTNGDGDAWVIGIEDPFAPERDLVRVALAAGALATSSRLERQWPTTGGLAHHLIDPTTGLPARGPLAAVSVLASTVAWAEVLAKATLVSGDVGLPGSFGCTGVVTTIDGSVRHLPGMEDWLV